MLHQWLRFFYDWPSGAIWGNVVVVTVAVPLGWVWSKSKFWPLRPIKHAVDRLHEKVDAHHELVRAEYQKAEEHRRWQYDAMHAANRGESLPSHPHYTVERTP